MAKDIDKEKAENQDVVEEQEAVKDEVVSEKSEEVSDEETEQEESEEEIDPIEKLQVSPARQP